MDSTALHTADTVDTVGTFDTVYTIQTTLCYLNTYLIFVIFFTLAKFLENKIYTEISTVNCQFTH